MTCRLGVASLIVLCVAVHSVGATTRYNLRLNLSQFSGDSLQLAFDLTSADSIANVARILALTADGRTGAVGQSGGPVSGSLVETGLPGDATIHDDFFYNQVVTPFDSVGSQASAALELTEVPPPAGTVPDQLSFFLLHHDGTPAFTTTDPLGAGALFAVDITGASGGDLSVYAPMRFVAPDTLRMSNYLDAVASGAPLRGRVMFTRVSPNPATGVIRIEFEIPEPGDRVALDVLDIAGRHVASVLRSQPRAGHVAVSWSRRGDDGREARSGVYLLRLRATGQTVVRKVALTR
jgi:hypothetical protein